jgi:cell division protease FtsH
VSSNPPAPNEPRRPPDRPGGPPDRRQPTLAQSIFNWRFLLPFAVLLVVNYLIVNVVFAPPQAKQVTLAYSDFKAQVVAGNVTSVTSRGDAITGVTKNEVADSSNAGDKSTHFATQVPMYGGRELEALLDQHGVRYTAQPDTGPPFWQTAILSFGPTLLLILGFLYLTRRASAGAGGVFRIGQSRARLYDAERPRTTFADVAGIDEAKQELQEVVDFLRQPQRYQRLGGTVPKGVLLVGPPGTGKTLLARAVAGEAGVPFYSVAASEFVEMIVGVGASRVRDLFNKARQAAPAIIFIDEMDAIGRSRAAAIRVGGTDEQEQTLNQILTEMDGFDSREGVIVLAATNRADVLDAALLRPGRFDRRVMVQPPDRAGRAAILRIHTRSVPLAADVDMDLIAQQTAGMVGADLRNLVNEAALLAARKDRDAVVFEDFTEAIEKVLLGAERKVMMSREDRERVAYHEGGHALLGLLLPGADPVRKVTIVPRGRSLGVTVQSPVDDRFNYTEEYLRSRIAGALGGRAAEQLVYGVVSTGAENDLQQVTTIAREMVARWGMSPRLGPLNLSTEDGAGPLGLGQRPFSEATGAVIDAEIKRIVEECLAQAERLLGENRGRLDALAEALLKEESLDEADVLRVTGLPRRVEPVREPSAAGPAAPTGPRPAG